MGSANVSNAQDLDGVQYLVALSNEQGEEGGLVYRLKDEESVQQLLKAVGNEQQLGELLKDVDRYQPGDSVRKAKALVRSVIYESHDAVWNSVRAILD